MEALGHWQAEGAVVPDYRQVEEAAVPSYRRTEEAAVSGCQRLAEAAVVPERDAFGAHRRHRRWCRYEVSSVQQRRTEPLVHHCRSLAAVQMHALGEVRSSLLRVRLVSVQEYS